MEQNEIKNEDDCKEEAMDDFSYCDIYTLFNVLQFERNKLFIDIRPKYEFMENRINHFINIAFDILSDDGCDEKIIEQLCALKKQRMQQMIFQFRNAVKFEVIYAISNHKNSKNDMELYGYLKKLISDTFGTKLPIIILNTDANIFCRQFPFLCNRTDDEILNYPSQIVNNQLFLGNMTQAKTKPVLMNLCITHIINVTQQSMNQIFDVDPDLNIKYLQCPIYDCEEAQIQTYFEEGIAFIEHALDKIENRVLVHCQAGVSRSSTIIIAYLMKIKRMSFKEAYQYTLYKREIIEPNDGFIEQLKLYQKNDFVVKIKKDDTDILGLN